MQILISLDGSVLSFSQAAISTFGSLKAFVQDQIDLKKAAKELVQKVAPKSLSILYGTETVKYHRRYGCIEFLAKENGHRLIVGPADAAEALNMPGLVRHMEAAGGRYFVLAVGSTESLLELGQTPNLPAAVGTYVSFSVALGGFGKVLPLCIKDIYSKSPSKYIDTITQRFRHFERVDLASTKPVRRHMYA